MARTKHHSVRKAISKTSNMVKKSDGRNDINTSYSNEPGRGPLSQFNQYKKRGLEIYNLSQIVSATGRDQSGRMISWGVEQPYFFLAPMQRNDIFKLSTPVFGVVSSRMQRISSLDFEVVPMKHGEDEMADEMKGMKQIYEEFSRSLDLKHLMVKANIVQKLTADLPELLPDMSNFNRCLMRWKKKIQNIHVHMGDEIKEWLMEPNNGVTWSQYVKKFVYDCMIHGGPAVYKQYEDDNNGHKRLENFDCLPGGTVYRFRAPYFSGVDGYIQMVPGYESQIFFANEMMFVPYLPTSTQNYPMIPLEALINKIAETLLFDRLMAEQADGTKPPEKLVIVTKGNQNPFGNFDNPEDTIPVDTDEQKRMEMKMNEPRRGAVMTFAGNDVKLIDLTRENTMELQSQRQKDIREDVALVYNMSNSEINMPVQEGIGGSKGANETQQEIEQGKGIMPIVKLIEESHTKYIIPFRYGYGYKLEASKTKNLIEEEQKDALRLSNGKVTVNELREEDSLPTFDDPKYDLPKGDGPATIPGQNEISPQYVKQVI
jgi:hypothetical protein